MLRTAGCWVVFASVAALAGGCAGGREPEITSAPRGLVCDTVSSSVTNFGRATTALYAETNLKLHQADLRGDMVRGGVRRVHVHKRHTECREIGAGGSFGGIHKCTAIVQLCGN